MITQDVPEPSGVTPDPRGTHPGPLKKEIRKSPFKNNRRRSGLKSAPSLCWRRNFQVSRELLQQFEITEQRWYLVVKKGDIWFSESVPYKSCVEHGQFGLFINKPQFQATADRNEKHAKNALLQRRPHPPTFPQKQAHCFLFLRDTYKETKLT